jgi:hypothetical protein
MITLKTWQDYEKFLASKGWTKTAWPFDMELRENHKRLLFNISYNYTYDKDLIFYDRRTGTDNEKKFNTIAELNNHLTQLIKTDSTDLTLNKMLLDIISNEKTTTNNK